MNKINGIPDTFTAIITEAIKQLRNKNLKTSEQLIEQALTLNVDAPEPHNLLGILYEQKGDNDLARKHYRASYALSPSYKAACHNLERLVGFEWGQRDRNYDYGDILEVIDDSEFSLDMYDELLRSK